MIVSTIGDERYWLLNQPEEWSMGAVIPLPHGHYKLIGKPTQLSESDWEGIVGDFPYIRHDRESLLSGLSAIKNKHLENRKEVFANTATESGLSWIRSLNLDPEKVVILKIEK
jgi:hypothetical protein